MNNVNIAGKVTRIRIFEKVAYLTVCVYSGKKKYEFIDTTSFSPEFVSEYIHTGDFVAINGALHVNGQEHNYKMEFIGENISLMNQNRDTFIAMNSELDFEKCEHEDDAELPWLDDSIS